MHSFDLETGRSRPIYLWCTFYSDLEDEALLREYRSLLSEAERQQELRCHFARDRRRYLVTRALVRTVLSRYTAIAPSEWTFAVNDYGRPLIANTAWAARQISFNVSHTDSLIILAVAQGHELGVDGPVAISGGELAPGPPGSQSRDPGRFVFGGPGGP